MISYPYEVRLAPGCYSGPNAPLVSRHRTLRAAVLKERRSDRWVVKSSTSSATIYHAASRQPTRLGYGLYGDPDTRTLREAMAIAEAAAR